MKITVLVDNNTMIDQYFVGEPALAFYIEDRSKQMLFDSGYSDVVISNASLMKIDLSKPMEIVISHGHNDHTGGLAYMKNRGLLEGKRIIAHPDTFRPKRYGHEDIGSPVTEEELRGCCLVHLTDKPYQLTDHLVYLGEIPKHLAFEKSLSIGEAFTSEDKWENDHVLDDSAIAYRGEKGLFIVTGCSHSGICNIIEYAKEVCNEDRIAGVIGGFHLFETDQRLEDTIRYFKRNNITNLYPCHCVSFAAKSEIHKEIPITEIGVGYEIYVD